MERSGVSIRAQLRKLEVGLADKARQSWLSATKCRPPSTELIPAILTVGFDCQLSVKLVGALRIPV